MADRALVRAIASGHHELVREVARRYHGHIRAAAQRHVDPHAAEDVAQEVLIKLLHGADSITDGAALPRWLSVVASRLAIDRARAAAHMRERPDPDISRSQTPVDHMDVAHVVESKMVADALLTSVRPADAELLAAHYIHQRSLREVAEGRGMTIGAVKIMLHRSRARARQIAADKGLAGLPGLEWLRRYAPSMPNVGDVLVYGVATVLIVAGIGGLAPDRDHGGQKAWSRSVSDASVTGTGNDPEASVSSPTTPTSTDTSSGPASSTAPAAAGPTTTGGPDDSTDGAYLLDPPAVDVPGSDRSVHGGGDAEPRYRAQFGGERGPAIESEDDDRPEATALIGVLCTGADLLTPAADCTTRED